MGYFLAVPKGAARAAVHANAIRRQKMRRFQKTFYDITVFSITNRNWVTNNPSLQTNSELLGGGPKPSIVLLKPGDGGDILHSHLH
jgi:hypothetical protein